jgi:hypothetical protein
MSDDRTNALLYLTLIRQTRCKFCICHLLTKPPSPEDQGD